MQTWGLSPQSGYLGVCPAMQLSQGLIVIVVIIIIISYIISQPQFLSLTSGSSLPFPFPSDLTPLRLPSEKSKLPRGINQT